jgi:hypothetical protein
MGVKLRLCYGSKWTKDLREPGAEGDTEAKRKYRAVGGNCVVVHDLYYRQILPSGGWRKLRRGSRFVLPANITIRRLEETASWFMICTTGKYYNQAVGGNCVKTWFMICTTGKYYNQAVGGNCVMTWFMICTTGKYYNNQIEDGDKSGKSDTHVEEETAHIL